MKTLFLPVFDDINWHNEKICVNNLKSVFRRIDQYPFIHAFKYIKKLYSHYNDVLQDYLKTRNDVCKQPPIKSLRQYEKQINEFVTNSTDNSIVISSTHLSTYFTIKTLKNSGKICIICFDAHADTCSALKPAWKGNVFSKLLQENFIDGLVIVSGNKLKKSNDNRVLTIKYSSKSFQKIKSFLYKNDFDKLYFSYDIDVLNTYNEFLTAMEYNSFNVIRYLSLNDAIQINSFFKLYKSVKHSFKVPNHYGYKNLYKSGFSGISEYRIETLINNIINFAKTNKISIGLVNENGYKIYGDIVEYYGYDYKNKTIDCINCFVNNFERSLKNEGTFS